MLFPADILPFLFDPLRRLREYAIEYLADAHDPSPLTLDDLWRAVDEGPPDEGWVLTRYLSCFPPTPRSVKEALLRLPHVDGKGFGHLSLHLAALDPEIMREGLRLPGVYRRLHPETEWTLVDALRLADLTFDGLWSALEAYTAEIQDARFSPFPIGPHFRNLARAMVRSPEQAAARALEVLLGPPPEDGRQRWMLLFAVQLLGRVRHPVALGPLLALLDDEHPAFWTDWDLVEDALVRLGTPEVVAQISDRFAGGSQTLHHSGVKVLGRIKRPSSEEALVRILRGTTDPKLLTRTGMALCHLATTSPEALDHLRSLVDARRFIDHLGALDEELLTVCRIHGWEPIEAPTWRGRIAARDMRDHMEDSKIRVGTGKRRPAAQKHTLAKMRTAKKKPR